MPTYTVCHPMRDQDGHDLNVGDSIELTERQAKYQLLSGKVATPTVKPTAKPAAGGKKKE